MVQGLQEVQDYYKVPNVYRSIKTLRITLKDTVAYVDKQLEPIYHIRPYAELHYKKAVDEKLPASGADNPKNFFRAFHHLGHYKRYLYVLIQQLKTIFQNHGKFEEEQIWCIDGILLLEDNFETTNRKIRKNKNNRKINMKKHIRNRQIVAQVT